jgi:hypothetical protein
MDVTREHIEQVQKRLSGSGVIDGNRIMGTAIGEKGGRRCLVVMTNGATEQDRQAVRSHAQDCPIDFVETGQFIAQAGG